MKNKDWYNLCRSKSQAKERNSMVSTRFTNEQVTLDPFKAYKRRVQFKYSQKQVIEAVRLASEIGVRRAAEQMGIPMGTVHTWFYRRRPNKTGRYTHETLYRLACLAREYYLGNRELKYASANRVEHCMARAASDLKMNLRSVKVFRHMECIPVPPGFPLYADPEVQARCEAMARGEREAGNPLVAIKRIQKTPDEMRESGLPAVPTPLRLPGMSRS